MIRILIADDHEILRRGLREILAGCLSPLTVSEAKNASEAINLLIQDTWDLVLLDINMPGRSGLEVLEEARRIRPRTPVLVLTGYPEEQFAIRAFRLGASGYITKHEAADQLVTAVRRVLAGGKYITPALAERLAASLGHPQDLPVHEALSQRELQVLQRIATGKTVKEIADELGLSEKTVATYRTRIRDKTGLKSNVDIARYAIKYGVVE